MTKLKFYDRTYTAYNRTERAYDGKKFGLIAFGNQEIATHATLVRDYG